MQHYIFQNGTMFPAQVQVYKVNCKVQIALFNLNKFCNYIAKEKMLSGHTTDFLESKCYTVLKDKNKPFLMNCVC